MAQLDAIFHPQSVVVIGASEKPDSMGGLVIQNLAQAGYKGQVFALNLKNYNKVFDVPCYKKMADLPITPDLAVICIPQKNIPRELKEIGEKGIKAALILTGGVARRLSEGKTIAERLNRVAREYGIRLLGPNCMGVIVPDEHLNLSFSHINAQKGKVAFIGQSASLGSALLDWATGRDIGFSHFVTVGERADVNASDIIDYLSADRRVRSVLLHVEKIRNPRRFMTVLRAASKNKTVLAIKTTTDENVPKGLISRDQLDNIFFDRAGVMLVESLDQMFNGLETLSRRKPLYGDKLAIICNGLGPAILAEQELKRLGGQLADLSHIAAKEEFSLWYNDETGGNPLVLSPQMEAAEVKAVFKELDKDPNIGAILFIHSPNQRSQSASLSQEIAPILRRCYHTIFSCWMGDATVEQARTLFDQNALLNYESPNEAVAAFMTMVHHQDNQAQLRQTPSSIQLGYQTEKETARHLLRSVQRDERDYLTWLEARKLLTCYGIELIDTHFAPTFGQLIEEIDNNWFPVALRVIHEQGCYPFNYQGDAQRRWKGVAINQKNSAQLVESQQRLKEELAGRFDSSNILGYSVQPMLRRLDSVQFSMGITRDEVYGPIIFFGEGGSAADMLADRQYTLPPLNASLATQLIESSHAWQILKESSLHIEHDRQMLLQTLMTLSQMVIDHAMIAGLEINFLLESGQRLVALNVACNLADEVLPVISPYPAHMSEGLQLKNGTKYTVRPIKGEDEPLLKAFFDRMPAEDLRFRFFGSRINFEHRELAAMCQIDYEREMVFVAISEGKMQGELRMSLDIIRNELEFSIMVERSTQGTGLASALMDRMIRYSRQRGVSAIVAEVMDGNRAMLGLGEKYKFAHTHAEEGVVSLRLDI